jgi:outer membrane protein OmpA-like peptidoglycan-associated protein
MTRSGPGLAAGLVVAVLWPALAAACPVEAMQQARSAAEAAVAHAGILRAASACTAAQRDWSARLAAAHHFAVAVGLQRQQRPPAEVKAALDAALGFGPLWQAYALRGDIRQRLPDGRGRVDFAAASLDYQMALNEIEAGNERVDAVPETVIASLFRRAEQTRMLADGAVATPVTRSGAPGGLALRQVRSFAPVAVAIPVQFEFATATPTEGGRRAAAELAALLEAEGRPPITLVGHTDPEGDAELNRALSVRRAEAIRSFLVQRGYDPQRIRVVGRGQEAPLQIENRDGYTRDQIHQILRRVELVRE